MKAISNYCDELWSQAEAIWLSGGWPMLAIAAVALVMFAVGMNASLQLSATGFRSVPERVWRGWIEQPHPQAGRVGELLQAVSGASSLEDAAVVFEQVRANELAAFERDLRLMKVCVGAAPLLGLLGTVVGMLTTFGALASGSGGERTMGLVAGGIAEALVTTETGLIVALPGMFLQHQLARKLDRYRSFLAHVETACMQHRFKKMLLQAAFAGRD